MAMADKSQYRPVINDDVLYCWQKDVAMHFKKEEIA